MLKVLKNLKKSWVTVLIVVILLCIQATTDLALPDYTSKIVNVGIQYGGIEEAVPEVMNEEMMEDILLFSDEDDKILENYELVKSNPNSHQEKIIKKYLGKDYNIEENNLYILKDIDEEKLNSLENILVTPLIEYNAVTNEETAKQIKDQMMQNMSDNMNKNEETSQMATSEKMIKEYKNSLSEKDIMDVLKEIPEDKLQSVLEQFTGYVSQMSDSIKSQAAISAVKEVYIYLGVDTDKLQNNYILTSGLQMLGVALISMISAVLIMLLSSRIAARLGRTLRDKVFRKVLSFSTAELREFSTASLITRSTNDIQQIQQLITFLFRVVVYAPIIGIGGFIKVLTTSNNAMAWIAGVAILAILFVVGTLFIVAMPKFKRLQDLIDKLNQVSREILTGLPVIRAFNKEKKEEKRFDDSNSILMKTNIFVNRAMSMMMPLLMFIMSSITVLIVWVGAHNVDSGTLQVGDMMAFIQYTMQIVMAFLMISVISILLPRAAVSARRINEVIDTEPSIKDKDETKKFNPDKKGLVEFKNVSFRYPDADTEILEDINFTAEPGKTTALIGSTGSGKSTVINLIPRFYDVTGGELLVDGVNVKDVPQKDLRDIIGFVPQKGVLFSGTIESNIKYSDENMPDKQMEVAAEIAQATEFIEGKEQKYKDPIAQGGSNVSGGQKQRLSIARAIAKDPEIFIFDDSFSALDFKTDSKLREALAEKTENKTVIIVAQRISTILNADKIIVLEEGKIVGQGTHEELMKNNETYRQIALSQLSKDELNEKGGK
jgi:ATP-binding cassette subfamily B multidrug efflux pump